MVGINAHFFIFTIVIYRIDTAIKYIYIVLNMCVCGVCVATSTRLLYYVLILPVVVAAAAVAYICIAGTSNLWKPVIIGSLCNI